jgi:pSer/pThr/pTyr-binding forkhead associated (FHA) protein
MPDMITLKHFSLFAGHVDKLACETLPACMTFDEYQFNIGYEQARFIINCNRPFLINSHKSSRAEIKHGDLINFDHEFILFDESHRSTGNGVFVGKIHIPGIDDKLLIFRLSRKNTGKDFTDIAEVMQRLPDAGKIFIDVAATQFMDSNAIRSMMALIQQAGDAKRSLYFYKPSQKFITYMKLANIEKKVPLLSSPNPYIDLFIEKRSTSLQNLSGAVHFSISASDTKFTVPPETVLPVGRMNTMCGLLLSDSQISRIHVLFVNTDARLYLIDCNSTNFSYINGQKVSPYCLNPLKNNDTVAFGQNSHFTINRI